MYGQLILDKDTNGEYINWERLFSLINGTGNHVHLQKNEIGPLSYTNHKNQLKMVNKCKAWNCIFQVFSNQGSITGSKTQ